MSGAPGLSACVIACNEECELPRCLDSVAFADEIVVVIDAKSTDRTEAIARERASRVEVRPYEGDIEQKRYATSLATREWVLVIDPDEVASAELDRLTWYLGRWIRHGDFYPDWTLRLFRRDAYRWQGANPHGRIEVSGPVGRLEGVLEHYSYRDIADHVDRVQRWSTQAALAMAGSGRRARARDLLLRPIWRGFRGYVLKRGFLDGAPGLVVAFANAGYVFLKYAKLWERTRRA